MQRRDFLGIPGSAAAWPIALRAQTPGRTYRIGYLAGASRLRTPQFVAFLDELGLAGFIEGQNLTVLDDGFSATDSEAAAAAMAAVKVPADAIVAFGPVRIRAVQMATKTIPLLTISEDLVAEGLASSLDVRTAIQRASA
jgi:putative ABC transport system substrate-binding protein